MDLPKGEQQQQSSLCLPVFSKRWVSPFIDAYDIPDDLVINIDQTPLPLILLSKYTMDKKNEKLVPIANSVDYRQVTGTLVLFYSCK